MLNDNTKKITSFAEYANKPLDEKEKRLDSYLKLIVLGGRPLEITKDEGLVELTKHEDKRLDLDISIDKLKIH